MPEGGERLGRAAEGLSVRSINTGAYCRARQRLPLDMIKTLSRQTARLLSERAPQGWRWRGRCVKLVDGTGISMPDTDANQIAYPQPTTQAPGVGFPLARVVAVICLATGALLDAAIGPHAGKQTGELALLRRLQTAFSPGDIMLADALYCSYFLIATLKRAGVDVVFAQHGGRRTDFRRGKKLAPRDHRVSWHKPSVRLEWMSAQDYAAFPDQLSVREVKVDGRVLVTTMLDARAVHKTKLAELYEARWNVELDLRNIKTTLGMDVLSCTTPQMNEKELWVHLLAYNLIRLLMAQAAANAAVHPRQLSFKHTMQLWTKWIARRLCANRAVPIAQLFELIVQLRVGKRPGRVEPRARKRRPKPYPLLKIPRDQARMNIVVHGHP